MEKTLGELAELVGGTVIGDSSVIIFGISKIEEGLPGTISFLANPKYKKYLSETKSSAVLVPKTVTKAAVSLIQVDDSYLALRNIALYFHPPAETSKHFVHPLAHVEKNAFLDSPVHVEAFAYIGKNVQIGKYSHIGAHSYLGNEVKIGECVYIFPGVTILKNCEIGNNVLIHSGTVIGSDGFGYAKDGSKYLKIPQTGNVVIADNVEIGANCTIDRASIGSTRIGKGSKLDNLVQIAHNVEIGKNTVIAAQTGISGSTKIGSNVIMGGQVGTAGHIEIGDNTILGGRAGVTKSIPPDSFFFGYPARDHKTMKKREALLNRLPGMHEKIKLLISKSEESKSS